MASATHGGSKATGAGGASRGGGGRTDATTATVREALGIVKDRIEELEKQIPEGERNAERVERARQREAALEVEVRDLQRSLTAAANKKRSAANKKMELDAIPAQLEALRVEKRAQREGGDAALDRVVIEWDMAKDDHMRAAREAMKQGKAPKAPPNKSTGGTGPDTVSRGEEDRRTGSLARSAKRAVRQERDGHGAVGRRRRPEGGEEGEASSQDVRFVRELEAPPKRARGGGATGGAGGILAGIINNNAELNGVSLLASGVAEATALASTQALKTSASFHVHMTKIKRELFAAYQKALAEGRAEEMEAIRQRRAEATNIADNIAALEKTMPWAEIKDHLMQESEDFMPNAGFLTANLSQKGFVQATRRMAAV